MGIYFNNPKKIDVQDCVCDEFYSLFRTTSHLNTVVYDNVFKCLPSDNILSFESLSSYTSKPSLSKYDPIKVTLLSKYSKIKFNILGLLGQRRLGEQSKRLHCRLSAQVLVPGEKLLSDHEHTRRHCSHKHLDLVI